MAEPGLGPDVSNHDLRRTAGEDPGADSRTDKDKDKAVYSAFGVTRDGLREVLGLWITENESAKFWLSVMNELKNRGLQDIFIAVVDRPKGFPDAITAAFPEPRV